MLGIVTEEFNKAGIKKRVVCRGTWVDPDDCSEGEYRCWFFVTRIFPNSY